MKCIYHNDMDGRCAAALIAYFTGYRNNADYIECDYRHFPIDEICDSEDVFIVDYSFTSNTVEYLKELIYNKKCNVVWIDHHKSSVDLNNGFDSYDYQSISTNENLRPYHIPNNLWIAKIPGIRSQSGSGAALTWRYFMEDAEPPMFVKYVDDYDRWIYKYGEDTIYFKLGLETVDFDALDPIWSELLDNTEKTDGLIAVGGIIKQHIDKDHEHYLSMYGYESKILDIPCYVVNRKTNSWIFGDKINDYPVVIVWAFDGSLYSYSLYSNDTEVDCAKIAESFGGGGHPGAAGFTSDKLLFTKTS